MSFNDQCNNSQWNTHNTVIDEYAFVIDQCLNVSYGQNYNHSKVECTDDGANV